MFTVNFISGVQDCGSHSRKKETDCDSTYQRELHLGMLENQLTGGRKQNRNQKEQQGEKLQPNRRRKSTGPGRDSRISGSRDRFLQIVIPAIFCLQRIKHTVCTVKIGKITVEKCNKPDAPADDED